jgi:3-methylcrotonyl-CoA carboxylase alpha subunit
MATKLIEKVLIANRGEIACRVIKTAKKLGIKSVAVYSESDVNSLHTSLADESYFIGPSPASESYLNKSKILEIAAASKSQAIHPGYGFLSENADFCEQCQLSGIIFIGPPSKAIKSMGSKSESKKIMIQAAVPVVPGYHQDDQDSTLLKREAERIGYPVLIKAVMGGGGKGMKLVTSAKDFDTQLESAKRESLKSFGDDRVIIEKYITSPRHIEVQVFTDLFGNAVYLFERDCSIQRRHQKVIEEAPSYIDELKRHNMGQTATQAAIAVGYVGAGTVEFIFDENTQEFYFMEMNTRLQVEHPVTEMITGLDLVEWQLKVASGLPLPLKQHEIQRSGHAIEARIYAEDPFNSFLPTSGKILHLSTPETGPTVRIDSGAVQNDEISVFYDPLISKLIVWGKDRQEAINLLYLSLIKYHICGLPTNIQFLRSLLQHPDFKSYNFNTNFIPNNSKTLLNKPLPTEKDYCIASACMIIKESSQNSSPWHTLKDFRVNSTSSRKFLFESDTKLEVEVTRDKKNLQIKTNQYEITVSGKEIGNNVYEIITPTDKQTVRLLVHEAAWWFINNEGDVHVLNPIERFAFKDALALKGSYNVLAPIPGKIIKIPVKEGEEISERSTVAVIESMKMEHMITAPVTAKVLKILHKEGDFVNSKSILIVLG